MANYVQFPRGGIQQQMTGGAGQPNAFVPYTATGGPGGGGGGGGRGEYVETHQRAPSGGGGMNGGGMIPMRMADGSQGFAPAGQMGGGQLGGGQMGGGQLGGQMSAQWAQYAAGAGGHPQGPMITGGAISGSSSPGGMGGGMGMVQPQMTGYNGQQPYGAEVYQQQTDVQTKRSSKGSKKAKEWEKEQRAREEAEEKFRQQSEIHAQQQAQQDRLGQNPAYTSERNRRPSAGASLQPAQSINNLNQRFNAMSMAATGGGGGLNPNSAMMGMAGAGGVYQRPRGLSVSEQAADMQGAYGSGVRSRRVSVSAGAGAADPRETVDFSNGQVRTRKMSSAAQNPYGTPGSTLGNFYDAEGRAIAQPTGVVGGGLQVGKSPYARPGSLPPGAFMSPDGRVMIPNPALSGGAGHAQIPLAPQMTGGAASMYGGGHGSGFGSSPSGGAGRVVVPTSFYREPSRSAIYTRFTPFAIIWDLNELKQLVPPLPALLVPNDVHHEDWNRCISDVTQSWSGVFPYNLWNNAKKQSAVTQAANPPGYRGSGAAAGRMPTMRPSSAVARAVDIWNISFFHDRGLELVLYRGLERRTGETAGSRNERMKLDMVPQQYQMSIMGRRKRRPPVTPLGRGRRGDEDDSDDIDSEESSLTSSSESSSSSSEDEDEVEEDDEEEEDNYGGTRRYSTQSKSRRNSMAASVDQYEKWAKKSRGGWKLIEKRQKLQKKRRKLERRQRRQMMREEPLYSMWMSCRDGR
ncbi:hypothetical protein FRB94_004870 [Tulasnella sp. JGI-2019a]|nr:hypothetical protein FRB93_005805 [Tulasnella sp. JGI-2019a]KAG9001217.1 hypothetical protein FRB94_004870 [Tulasnella sp. JGI-2019a]KAG9024318.1 hypothetical protein FRB95_011652 [Tulasnella sp. JGI-2019a]